MLRDELEGSMRATDTESNLDTRPCTSTAYHGNEGPEAGNQNLVERLQHALEHYRGDEEQRTRDEASRWIQECIAWLTSSRRGTEQLEEVLTASAVGTRANSAMHDWWVRRDVESPSQACAYIQGINQAAHPGEIYGDLTAQVIEDLIQAGGASDLIMQDLTKEPSSQEEADRRFDEDLVSRIRDRLLNQQYWNDGEAWLRTADRNNLTFKWITSQLRRQRRVGGSHPGAAQMALHNVEIRTQWGGDRRTDMSTRVIRDLRDVIIDLQNSIGEVQSDAMRANLANGQAIANEWCVVWTNEELSQAVHAPMHKNQTHNALIGMQPLAKRFGARVVPVETGVAIIGCAPAIADAVLRTRMASTRGENTLTAKDLYVQDALRLRSGRKVVIPISRTRLNLDHRYGRPGASVGSRRGTIRRPRGIPHSGIGVCS